jgi:hypothetical protein
MQHISSNAIQVPHIFTQHIQIRQTCSLDIVLRAQTPLLGPHLFPPLLTVVAHPAACKVHDEIARLPLHCIIAHGVCVCDALLDETEVLSEGLMMLDEVQLNRTISIQPKFRTA